MFKPGSMRDVIARRAGRIAFGTVLLLGFGLLVASVIDQWRHTPHVWVIITGTWLAAWSVQRSVRERVKRSPRDYGPDTWRVAGHTVPAVGIALLLPLTIHLPIAVMLGGQFGFDIWSFMSLLVVGHVHVVFAVLACLRARKLALGLRARTARSVYWWSVLASLLPTNFLFPIAPVLVAVTGIPIRAWLEHQEVIATREAEPIADVPFAIARAA